MSRGSEVLQTYAALSSQEKPSSRTSTKKNTTYTITNPNRLTGQRLEITKTNSALRYYAKKKWGFLSRDNFVFHKNSPAGPIVANAELKTSTRGCKIEVLSDAEIRVASQSFTDRQFGFTYRGTKYLWRRTRSKALLGDGVSSGMKLIEVRSVEHVVGAFKKGGSWSRDVGRVEFFPSAGVGDEERELVCMVALFGFAASSIGGSSTSMGGIGGGAAAIGGGGGGGGGC